MEHFVDLCRGMGLKVNADKSRVMVLSGKEGLKYEVLVNRMRLEHVSEFKYLECVVDELGIDVVECRKVVIGRKVVGAIRSLVNVRRLYLECAKLLHKALLVY